MDGNQLKRCRSSSVNPSSSFPPSSKKPPTSLANPSNFDASSGSSQATAHLSSDIQTSGSASQAPIGQFQVAPNYNTQRSADQPTFGNMDSMSPTFLGMGPVRDVGVGGVDPATSANTALAETQSFPNTYLKPFKDFNQAVTTLTKVGNYCSASIR
ncbi:hypothetical protein M404DRAFT_1006275 [Pisolithus tinctorius Marx 270]|uniref:Uncharacterized protein n=1 Tax=Pisolithus tinctorius Marx 270 TaxID=870435 RepID=A0A0C3IJG7_PISTI|nr:hypothetical protein M404DRAFT_1006275 [Pisolithus tinctorius Marx 270]